MGEVRLALEDIADGFRGHGGRYLLAAFAIAIGSMAVTALILIVQGLQQRIDRTVADFGANVVSIVRENELTETRPGLSMNHVELIRANFPDVRVAPVRYYKSRAAGARDPINVLATGAMLSSIRDWSLIEGRRLDLTDIESESRVVVVSRYLRDVEGWRVGQILLLDDTPFLIVGVVDVQGPAAGSDDFGARLVSEGRFATVPWSAIPWWRGEGRDQARRVEQIVLRGAMDAGRLLESVRSLITQPGVDAGSVTWVTARKLVADIERLKQTVLLSVGAISVLCLLLGGTTLMSLMVLNVRERIPEIGLRLSLGARRVQISALFVAEALLVTCASGAAGTVAAHLLLMSGGFELPFEVDPTWRSAVIPVAMVIALGCLFAWWPARMASGVSPAEALRSD